MPQILTIGHSTHAPETLLGLLRGAGVTGVADVRRFASSRRHPHTDATALERLLAGEGIAYWHLPELGGRRNPVPGSPNRGWRVGQFQGYADHMETAEFGAGLRRLLELASGRRVAVMCAEAQWWRCHRRLLSDALLVRGVEVRHIGPRGELTAHELTPFAVADGERLAYPPPQGELEV
jgi:uncharacterized protein (DUF488 family)